jgi:transcriptional regulator with XRE-family HTH domain
MIKVIEFSCIMSAVMETMFTRWLREHMQDEGWNQSELAKRTRINQAAISRLLSGRNSPSADTCKALARVFKVPVEVTLRAANIMPAELLADECSRVLYYQIINLPDEQRECAMEYIAFLYARSAKGE